MEKSAAGCLLLSCLSFLVLTTAQVNNDHPYATTDHPYANTDHPNVKTDHPNATTDHPNATTELTTTATELTTTTTKLTTTTTELTTTTTELTASILTCPETCSCASGITKQLERPTFFDFRGLDNLGRDGFSKLFLDNVRNVLTITGCTKDPSESLGDTLTKHYYPKIDGLEIHPANLDGCMRRLPNELRKFENLRYLNVSSNCLTDIPSSVQELMLITLDLSHNELTSVPDNILRSSTLKHLDVSHNNISHIHWSELRIKHFEARDNIISGSLPVKTLLDLEIEIFDISYNNIEILDVVGLTGMEAIFDVLDVSHNKIRLLDSWYFHNAVRDSRLDLANNLIMNFTNMYNYTGLRDSRYEGTWRIELANNNISTIRWMWETFGISAAQMANLMLQQHIGLNNNPLHCGCLDYSLYEYLLHRDWDSMHIDCHSPPQLAGQNVEIANRSLMWCDIDTGCPSGCHCFDTPWNKSLNVVCRNWNETALPTTVPELVNPSYTYYLNFDGGVLTHLSNRSYIIYANKTSFRDNQIDTIDDDFITDPFHLTVVDLTNNSLTEIDTWPMKIVFKQSVEINVTLDHNNISKFTNKVKYDVDEHDDYHKLHHKTTYVTFISLNFNQIEHLRPIMLNWNITPMIIQDLLNDDTIRLAENPLVCDCKDYDVYVLIHWKHNLTCTNPLELFNQSIPDIPKDKFRCNMTVHKDCPVGCECIDIPNKNLMNVTCQDYWENELPEKLPNEYEPWNEEEVNYHVYMDGLNLTGIHNRPWASRLQIAYFNNNRIGFIEDNFMRNMYNIDQMYLANNELRNLPDYLMVRPWYGLSLGDNLWDCTCKNRYTIWWLRGNAPYIEDYVNVRCHSPPKRRGWTPNASISDFEPCLEYGPSRNESGPQAVSKSFLQPVLWVEILILAVLIIILIVREYQRYKLRRDIAFIFPKMKDLDVYLSYDKADQPFVDDILMPFFDSLDLKVCPRLGPFGPRDDMMSVYMHWLRRCKCAVVVMTETYLENQKMNQTDMHMCFIIHGQQKHVIFIKDEAIDINKINIVPQQHFLRSEHVVRESARFRDELENLIQIARGVEGEADDMNSTNMPYNTSSGEAVQLVPTTRSR